MAETTTPKPKTVSLEELVEGGYLQEVNRLFFHPLGMELGVAREPDGTQRLGDVLDRRHDPDGCVFEYVDGEPGPEQRARWHANIKRVRNLQHEAFTRRLASLGFGIQGRLFGTPSDSAAPPAQAAPAPAPDPTDDVPPHDPDRSKAPAKGGGKKGSK